MKYCKTMVLIAILVLPTSSHAIWLQLITTDGQYAIHSKVVVGDSATGSDTYYTDSRGLFYFEGDPRKLLSTNVEYGSSKYEIVVSSRELQNLRDQQSLTIKKTSRN